MSREQVQSGTWNQFRGMAAVCQRQDCIQLSVHYVDRHSDTTWVEWPWSALDENVLCVTCHSLPKGLSARQSEEACDLFVRIQLPVYHSMAEKDSAEVRAYLRATAGLENA
jgi:hypothetical protein